MEQGRILSRRTAERELTLEEMELVAGGGFTINTGGADTLTPEWSDGIVILVGDDCGNDF